MSTVKVIISGKTYRFKHKIDYNAESIITIFETIKKIITDNHSNQYITIDQFYCKDLKDIMTMPVKDKLLKVFMYKCSVCNNVILDYNVCDKYGFSLEEIESVRQCDNCEDFDNEILKLKLGISK